MRVHDELFASIDTLSSIFNEVDQTVEFDVVEVHSIKRMCMLLNNGARGTQFVVEFVNNFLL